MIIIIPIIGLILLTAFFAWGYEQEHQQKIEEALPEHEYSALQGKRAAELLEYDPDKDRLLQFDFWLDDRLAESNRWVLTNPGVVILFLFFCYWVGQGA